MAGSPIRSVGLGAWDMPHGLEAGAVFGRNQVILKQQLRAKLYVRCRVFSLDDEAEETPATVLALYALNPQANLDVLIKGI